MPNSSEVAILIRWLRARGVMLIGIWGTLNEKGMRNRAGGIFKQSHVAQLLERHGDGVVVRSV